MIGKKKQENVGEISKIIEKVLVANMILSDKEYDAEQKIDQIINDKNKSNEEKESLKKGVLEELKNNNSPNIVTMVNTLEKYDVWGKYAVKGE